MKNSKISTLADLQEEKRRLSLIKEMTKREFFHSLGVMRSETKEFTLNKVAIPMGITVATSLLLNKVMTSNDKSQKIANSTENGIVNTIIALLPFAMKFLNK